MMDMEIGSFRARGLAILGAALLLVGCASDPRRVADPRDPFESYNRAVDRFNSDFDKAFMQPLAIGYQKLTPKPVDRGITNFFYNLDDLTSAVNNALQFKMSRAGSDVGRIFINSTVGILGFIDVATNVGLPSYKEDLGQTLGYWGVPQGAYLMLPLLGPCTVRDTIGFTGDMVTDPLFNISEQHVYWGLVGVRLIDRRADLLTAGQIVQDAAIDPYSFVRDAYLQRRLSLVFDGNPPEDQGQADFWDTIDLDAKGKPAGESPGR